MKRVKINNEINIYPFTDKDEIISVIEKLGTCKLIAINFRKTILADENLKEIINRDDVIGYADGMFPVNLLRKVGYKNAIRIPGVELWLQIIDKYELTKTFYIYGASQKVHNEAIQKLKLEFPKIKIVGNHHGYINYETVIDDIKTKNPDIIFVALGSPKQEYFIHTCFQKHKAIYQGLGGSFDVYIGRVKRAPKFFQVLGLEGAYRNLSSRKKFKRIIEVGKGYLMYKLRSIKHK